MKELIVSQMLCEYVRHGLSLNADLVGKALDAADLVEAEIERREAAAHAARALPPVVAEPKAPAQPPAA